MKVKQSFEFYDFPKKMILRSGNLVDKSISVQPDTELSILFPLPNPLQSVAGM